MIGACTSRVTGSRFRDLSTMGVPSHRREGTLVDVLDDGPNPVALLTHRVG